MWCMPSAAVDRPEDTAADLAMRMQPQSTYLAPSMGLETDQTFSGSAFVGAPADNASQVHELSNLPEKASPLPFNGPVAQMHSFAIINSSSHRPN